MKKLILLFVILFTGLIAFDGMADNWPELIVPSKSGTFQWSPPDNPPVAGKIYDVTNPPAPGSAKYVGTKAGNLARLPKPPGAKQDKTDPTNIFQ